MICFERRLCMSNYDKMIQLFEEVKDSLSANDLQYILELIQQYDNCRSSQEASSIENTIIDFCSKKTETKN